VASPTTAARYHELSTDQAELAPLLSQPLPRLDKGPMLVDTFLAHPIRDTNAAALTVNPRSAQDL
jgi:hypothetical protein